MGTSMGFVMGYTGISMVNFDINEIVMGCYPLVN